MYAYPVYHPTYNLISPLIHSSIQYILAQKATIPKLTIPDTS